MTPLKTEGNQQTNAIQRKENPTMQQNYSKQLLLKIILIHSKDLIIGTKNFLFIFNNSKNQIKFSLFVSSKLSTAAVLTGGLQTQRGRGKVAGGPQVQEKLERIFLILQNY